MLPQLAPVLNFPKAAIILFISDTDKLNIFCGENINQIVIYFCQVITALGLSRWHGRRGVRGQSAFLFALVSENTFFLQK